MTDDAIDKKPLNLIAADRLNIDIVKTLMEKPVPFAPGERLFWDDPHISRQMLEAHLSQDTEAASRKKETIDGTIAWIVPFLALVPGKEVLDLGCGPGLYSSALAGKGLKVTGIDFSRNSVDYARRQAESSGLPITYFCRDFMTIDFESRFDAVFQIYGELNTFGPQARDGLLQRIHRALKPGGFFVFDVSTRALRRKYGLKNRWYAAESGFWKPGPHIVLENGFDYPEQDLYLDQYIVIEANGAVSVYRNWFLDYSLEGISDVLAKQGFRVADAWGDLTGIPLVPESGWIAIAAVKEG
jgi:SAM-dependent methyltransferase